MILVTSGLQPRNQIIVSFQCWHLYILNIFDSNWPKSLLQFYFSLPKINLFLIEALRAGKEALREKNFSKINPMNFKFSK